MSERGGRRGASWLLVLLPAATFLVGLVLGGLVVWTGTGTGDASPDAAAAPTPTVTTVQPSPTVGADGACTQAAGAVAEATDLVREGVAATRDFRPDDLVAVLNQLEQLDPRLRELADRCSRASS